MNKRRIILSVGSICAVGLLGLLTSQVGGVSIRRVQPVAELSLSVHDPLVPGIRTKVTWNVPTDFPNGRATILLRTHSQNSVLATVDLFQKEAFVIPPCVTTEGESTMSIVTSDTREVLSSRDVTLLAPGPDCF